MGFEAHISDGLSYLERAGSGPVLVCLHGIGSNGGSFAPLEDKLPADWRVIAWHAPGYLTSQPLAQDWPEAAEYAAALEAFLDRLGLDKVMLLGHSLGCLTAASFVRRAPERVQGMVLACCALGHGVEAGTELSEASKARIADLEEMGPAAFAAARAPRLVFAPEANPEVARFVTDGMAQVSMPGYGQAARMLASGRLLDDLAHCAVPASVIYGVEDVITPPANSHKAHAAIPTACRREMVAIQGAGHAAYQQCPNEFAAAVVRCLTPEGGSS